jgi:tetratricopeptide (TPR) repeat protein
MCIKPVLCLLVFQFAWMTNITGQTFSESEQFSIDSLFSIVNDPTSSKVAKAQSYVQLSEVLYIVNLDTILPLCHAAKEIAEAELQNELKEEDKQSLYKSLATAYNNIAYVHDERGEYKEALEFYLKALAIQEEIGDLSGQATSLNNLGYFYKYKGDIDKALEYYHQSLEIRKEIGKVEPIANSLNNLAVIYNDQANIPKALEYYNQSLAIYEKTGDKIGQALLYNNLGFIYFKMDDLEIAEEYYYKSLSIRKEMKDEKGISNSYSNIGMVHKRKGDLDSALFYYHKNIEIDKNIGFKQGEASSYINLGGVHMALGDTVAAKMSFEQGLALHQEVKDRNGIAICLHFLGQIAISENDIQKAEELASLSLEYSEELGFPNNIRDAANTLYKVHKHNKNWKEALEMHELYMKMKDSLWNDENTMMAAKSQYKYTYEKQAFSDSLKQADELKVKNAEIEAEKAKSEAVEKQRQYLYIGLGLVALFGLFMFNRFRVTSRQKKTIEDQKASLEETHKSLEEKNNEIMGSIHYAKRIQAAVLPSASLINRLLPNSFILYKPKDIVAGDFYWLEEQGSKVLFAAADCTGHGVPGAMVSVICNNGLNRSVREKGLIDPGKILDNTRDIVISEFEKSEEEVKDGMDISLCVLDKVAGKLLWAGANNPLWIIRDGEMIIYKPDHQPIGKYTSSEPFTTHEISVEKDDVLYIFTDGYVDQFGGPKGKKMMASRFKKLLMEIHQLDIKEQLKKLDDYFESWRTEEEQIDDVCVIGIRV